MEKGIVVVVVVVIFLPFTSSPQEAYAFCPGVTVHEDYFVLFLVQADNRKRKRNEDYKIADVMSKDVMGFMILSREKIFC